MSKNFRNGKSCLDGKILEASLKRYLYTEDYCVDLMVYILRPT